MKLTHPRAANSPDSFHDDKSRDLIGVYIHDDRRGPYLRASLVTKDNQAQIHIDIDRDGNGAKEIWDMKHVIVPTPSKIRISMSGLRSASLHLVKKLHSFQEIIEQHSKVSLQKSFTYESWITRSHKYTEELVINASKYSENLAQKICNSISMSRHIGLISVEGGYFDPIDLLVDVTGTQRNAHCLGVCAKSKRLPWTPFIVSELSKDYRCRSVI